MTDHRKYAYLRQMDQAEEDEPGQRLQEAVMECGDEDSNLNFMKAYLCGICRRVRVRRAAHRYLPGLEDGVEAAVADANALLRALDRHEDTSPVKLVALRRAAIGQWRMLGEEDDRETRALAIKLLRVEVERGFTLAVAAAAETREEEDEELWGTPAEEEKKVAAAAEQAPSLECESEGAVEGVVVHAFRLLR